MKAKLLMLLVYAGAALAATASLTTAQVQSAEAPSLRQLRGYLTVRKPPQGIDLDTIRSVKATEKLPLWTFDALSSRDGERHQGVMVGRDPFNNPGSVSVSTTVIPLIIKTHSVVIGFDAATGTIITAPGVTIFNPTVADTGCLTAPNDVPTKLFAKSPIFNPATFDFGGTIVGTTQYSDAFQRGNFWNALGRNVDVYHVLLGPVKFLDPIVINVPAIYGLAYPAQFPPPACGNFGIVDINWFDALLTGSIIPALAAQGVNPSNFPIFFVHNLAWDSPVTQFPALLTLGYHGITGFPLPIQTYAAGDFDSTGLVVGAGGATFSDTNVFSHEVDEWMDDPFATNEVAPWGNVGQVTGCDNLLEVGDPLAGTDYPPIVMPNGFTYHLQELAFFSWFFGPPSLGIHGWFSDNGTFLKDAGPLCD
jgi:hypothetical protein